jgi:hypothetical protein
MLATRIGMPYPIACNARKSNTVPRREDHLSKGRMNIPSSAKSAIRGMRSANLGNCGRCRLAAKT